MSGAREATYRHRGEAVTMPDVDAIDGNIVITTHGPIEPCEIDDLKDMLDELEREADRQREQEWYLQPGRRARHVRPGVPMSRTVPCGRDGQPWGSP